MYTLLVTLKKWTLDEKMALGDDCLSILGLCRVRVCPKVLERSSLCVCLVEHDVLCQRANSDSTRLLFIKHTLIYTGLLFRIV